MVPAAANGDAATAVLTIGNGVAAGTYPGVTVRFTNAVGQSGTCAINVTVSAPSATYTPIFQIQGSGAQSSMLGNTVTTRGVVTRVNNNGYYLQDALGDGDAQTSDGLFVFTNSPPTVLAGQLIEVSGSVAEFNTGAAGNPQTNTRTVDRAGAQRPTAFFERRTHPHAGDDHAAGIGGRRTGALRRHVGEHHHTDGGIAELLPGTLRPGDPVGASPFGQAHAGAAPRGSGPDHGRTEPTRQPHPGRRQQRAEPPIRSPTSVRTTPCALATASPTSPGSSISAWPRPTTPDPRDWRLHPTVGAGDQP